MKKWCRHITWCEPFDMGIGPLPGAWSFHQDINGIRDVPSSWRVCPICSKPRPSARKTKPRAGKYFYKEVTLCAGCGQDYPCKSDCPAGTYKIKRRTRTGFKKGKK